MNNPKTQSLMMKLDQTTQLITAKLQHIIQLSSVSSEKTLTTMSFEAVQIDADTQSIIKGIEDLLLISRSLKESWMLNQLVEDDRTGVSLEQIEQKIDSTLELITNASKILPKELLDAAVVEQKDTEMTDA